MDIGEGAPSISPLHQIHPMTPLLYSEPWHLDWLSAKERKMNATMDHEELKRFVRVVGVLIAVTLIGSGVWLWVLFG